MRRIYFFLLPHTQCYKQQACRHKKIMAYDNESGLIPKNLTINNKLYYIRIDDVHVAFQL